jgi:hypothetical protein
MPELADDKQALYSLYKVGLRGRRGVRQQKDPPRRAACSVHLRTCNLFPIRWHARPSKVSQCKLSTCAVREERLALRSLLAFLPHQWRNFIEKMKEGANPAKLFTHITVKSARAGLQQKYNAKYRTNRPLPIFRRCIEAIREGILIKRVSKTDKEYHFQNWFEDRLRETKLAYDLLGRNTYPDFVMVLTPEGYELKGLAYPGRDASYDSNSQVPTGFHNGRTIYYVFGRYPKEPDGNEYPVLDLVLCHGDFLNADHQYTHKNKSVKGFGSYGDILIRDRKMYVVPTPFKIAEGLAHQFTLILPASVHVSAEFFEVGELIRTEASELLIGYSFDLQNNDILPKRVPNPGAGTKHTFRAWRLKGSPATPVKMLDIQQISMDSDSIDEETDG